KWNERTQARKRREQMAQVNAGNSIIIDIRKAGAWSLKLRAPAFFILFPNSRRKQMAQANAGNSIRVTPHK
ncbi:MAG: hypothetical protein U0I27_03060, partial [Christensenellales bacterium]|nr:hypothetical protein [Christensenellales bacterium]